MGNFSVLSASAYFRAPASMSVRPMKRLCTKTKASLPEPRELFDLEAVENPNARKTVYLVTLPHPRKAVADDGLRFVAPGTLTKEQV